VVQDQVLTLQLILQNASTIDHLLKKKTTKKKPTNKTPTKKQQKKAHHTNKQPFPPILYLHFGDKLSRLISQEVPRPVWKISLKNPLSSLSLT